MNDIRNEEKYRQLDLTSYVIVVLDPIIELVHHLAVRSEDGGPEFAIVALLEVATTRLKEVAQSVQDRVGRITVFSESEPTALAGKVLKVEVKHKEADRG